MTGQHRAWLPLCTAPPAPQEAVLENVGMAERAASAAESSSRRNWSQDSLRTELK